MLRAQGLVPRGRNIKVGRTEEPEPVGVWLETHNLSLSHHKETSDKQNEELPRKTKSDGGWGEKPVILKNTNVLPDRERRWRCPALTEGKDSRRVTLIHDPDPEPEEETDANGDLIGSTDSLE